MISLVVPLMRKNSVDDLLKHYENNSLINEVVLVDFDVEYTCSRLCTHSRKLTHLSVTNRQYFNKSLALNIGIHNARNPQIMCCDADVLIDSDVISCWSGLITQSQSILCSLDSVVETDCGTTRPGYGIVLGWRETFEMVDGYDSTFNGWGFEDLDFLERVERAGISIFRNGSGIHISHDDYERMNNYEDECKESSRTKNLNKFESKKTLNPYFGTLSKDVEQGRYILV